MSGTREIDLNDLLGPEPFREDEPIAAPVAPKKKRRKSGPQGKASRELKIRAESYPIAIPKKNSQETLKRLISYVSEMPIAVDACRRVGISFTTLKIWLQKSLEGSKGDGFDVFLNEGDEDEDGDNTIRFHLAFDAGIESGVALTERATIQRATGYSEPLTYQGKVVYRIDPKKAEIADLLGEDPTSPRCYLLDKFGSPVPESVWKMDPDLAMFILKARKPTVYGSKASIDVNVKGGVLVVPMRLPGVDLNQIEEAQRKRGRPSVTFEEGDNDDV